ncbi:hypothetical protein [Agrobacterium sp. SORGH_AS 787]|uniref:hypothetical protein n=1 Tax=Agrobacterium sp. SORGH_AS 787 TaxID=3041775 RepID=UPI00277E49AF|nr:hypothetical protein [Rhizobium sp. SORGH_AS_0787]
MKFLRRFFDAIKQMAKRGVYGGDLIYQIDISHNQSRRGLVQLIRLPNFTYTGRIRLHLNEASMIYGISLMELKDLSQEIVKALDAVEKDRALMAAKKTESNSTSNF